MSVEEAIQAGSAAEESGDFVAAAAAFTSLLDSPDARVAAYARFHLGRVVWKQGHLDQALELCQEAREMAVDLGDTDLRARVENAVGVVHVARGDYAQARAAYSVALELTTDTVTRAKIALNLGVIANIQGNFDSARRHYAQSLAMFRDAKDDRGEALALHNIGMLHSDRAEWDEAEEAFRSALALFERHGNRQMIANVLVNRSEVTYGRARYQEGIAHCDLALSIYAEIGDEVGRGEALRWKGHGLWLARQYDQAEATLIQSIRIAERTHVRLLEAEATRELGRVRITQGRKGEARDLYERSRTLFATLGASRELTELNTEIATLT